MTSLARILYALLAIMVMIGCNDVELPKRETWSKRIEAQGANTATPTAPENSSYHLGEDSVVISYYANKMIKEIAQFDEDGISFTWKSFYANGKLKSTGAQGDFNACGISVGTHWSFDSLTEASESRRYEHASPPDADGCHDTYTAIYITQYMAGKKVVSSSIETCYECVECPCGYTLRYGPSGKVDTVKILGSCTDFKLQCAE